MCYGDSQTESTIISVSPTQNIRGASSTSSCHVPRSMQRMRREELVTKSYCSYSNLNDGHCYNLRILLGCEKLDFTRSRCWSCILALVPWARKLAHWCGFHSAGTLHGDSTGKQRLRSHGCKQAYTAAASAAAVRRSLQTNGNTRLQK